MIANNGSEKSGDTVERIEEARSFEAEAPGEAGCVDEEAHSISDSEVSRESINGAANWVIEEEQFGGTFDDNSKKIMITAECSSKEWTIVDVDKVTSADETKEDICLPELLNTEKAGDNPIQTPKELDKNKDFNPAELLQLKEERDDQRNESCKEPEKLAQSSKKDKKALRKTLAKQIKLDKEYDTNNEESSSTSPEKVKKRSYKKRRSKNKHRSKEDQNLRRIPRKQTTETVIKYKAEGGELISLSEISLLMVGRGVKGLDLNEILDIHNLQEFTVKLELHQDIKANGIV